MKFVIVKSTPGWCKGKLRLIERKKLLINRNTPVGESADYYEEKPFGGKNMVFPVLYLELNEKYQLVEAIHVSHDPDRQPTKIT